MWTLTLRPLSSDSMTISVAAGRRPLTHGDIIQAWHKDLKFAAFWTDALATLPFGAFCWEMPPLTEAALQHPFACMVFDSPMLTRMEEDPLPFAEHLAAAGDTLAATFSNLSGDALLVAPVPGDDGSRHTHLAAFLRSAPPARTNALWAAVAGALLGRLGEAPVWVSTAGLGVGWLHVRVSSVPKYYRCRDYAVWDGW